MAVVAVVRLERIGTAPFAAKGWPHFMDTAHVEFENDALLVDLVAVRADQLQNAIGI